MQKQSQIISLSGAWDFSFTLPDTGEKYSATATVPGNLEPELQRLGLVEDYYPADCSRVMQKFESVDDWTLSYTFDAPAAPQGWAQNLVFEGIDTIAEIFLNGEKLADCNNMHLTYRLPVEGKLRAKNNTVTVVIHSCVLWAQKHKRDMFSIPHGQGSYYDAQVNLRKARYQWGWDNAPHLLTNGIWRPVYLEYLPPCRFDQVYLFTRRISDEQVGLGFSWSYETPQTYWGDHILRYTLYCDGKPIYTNEKPIWFPQGNEQFVVPRDQIKLWWPADFGSPDFCFIKIEMLQNGQTLAEWSSDWGIRIIHLERTEDILADGTGEFLFIVNGQKTYIRGTNWKPTSVFPALAGAKVEQGLDLVKDLHCNMIRIWGGGFYEDHAFFDYCDRNGILVWQDFMLACEIPSLDEDYGRLMAIEAQQVIEKLRNHASLAVWCGDNENDDTITWISKFNYILPSQLRISRQILKQAVLRYDPYRAYVESSPYASDNNILQRRYNLPMTHFQPELHLYVTSDVFTKSLRSQKSKFLGETGPIQMSAVSPNPKMLARELKRVKRLWDTPPMVNSQLHQEDGYFSVWRHYSRLACLQYFDRDFSVEEFSDWTLAVNFVCSLIFKDVVEYSRSMRWNKTGVLWWSLLDMWPMLFNYSVVDSDFCKKLPYFWIRNAQQPVALLGVRQEVEGSLDIYLANDTLQEQMVDYKITAYNAAGEATLLKSGSFTQAANEVGRVCTPAESAEPQLWILEWTQNGKTYYNHVFAGGAKYQLPTVRRWLAIIAQTCGYANEVLELKD